jgi:hypothetical protein
MRPNAAGTEAGLRGVVSPRPGNGLARRARGLRGPKAALSELRGRLGGCGTPTITVSLRFRVGIRAARNPLAMDILLDDRVAFPVRLPVDSDFAVIPVGARRNGRGCRASARNGNRRGAGITTVPGGGAARARRVARKLRPRSTRRLQRSIDAWSFASPIRAHERFALGFAHGRSG